MDNSIAKYLFLTMMSMLLELNNFHRQRTITKSRVVIYQILVTEKF